MLKETILTVQTCDLKVDINCNGCAKDIKKMMHKIEGVYKSNVDKKQGKVSVTGIMDMDTVLKKLKKAGMAAQLWDANPAAVTRGDQLGGSDRGDQLKDAGDKALPHGKSSSSGGCGARSVGSTNDARMVIPQLIPTTPQQHVPNIQQEIQHKLQKLKGEKLPPHVMGKPPTINSMGGKQSGKKTGGTKVLVPGNTNNGNKICPTSFPTMGQMGAMSMGLDGYNMQPYGGGAIHGLGMPASGLPGNGFYPSNAGSSGTEMMIQPVARNTMPQQPYMMVQPQQEHEKMMNAHYPHSQNAHYGPGCTGYQMMGYGNGHGHPQQHYPAPMYCPMPMPPQHDNNFNDENPNICSVM